MKIFYNTFVKLIKTHIRKLTFGQVIISVCIVALSIWCAYNVKHILIKYFDYSTIVTLHNEPPNSSDFPGITVCAPSVFKPQKLAELYPDFKKKLEEFENYQRERARMENFDALFTPNETQIKLLREYESYAMGNYSAKYIIKTLSVRPEELLIDCQYRPINLRNFQLSRKNNQRLTFGNESCIKLKPLLESIYEGRKCFTLFSDLVEMEKIDPSIPEFISFDLDTNGDKQLHTADKDCSPPHNYCKEYRWSKEFLSLLKDTKEKMHADLSPSIEVTIKALDDDVWLSYVADPIIMTVHPSNILQNRRDFMFFQLTSRTTYEILFSKKTTNLLKSPYKTACINYREEDHFFREGIKTQDQCISDCINQYKSDEQDCANYYSVLTESMFREDTFNMSICDHEHQDYNFYLEARNKCEDQCPSECKKEIFEITGQSQSTLDSEDNSCKTWYNNQVTKDKPATFDMKSDDLSNTSIESYPTVNSSPLMSTIQTNTYLPQPQHKIKYPKGTTPPSNRDIGPYNSLTGKKHQTLAFGCNAKVSIRISPKPFITIQHQEAITFEGFLGTVGGHLGIWLGLSLYKVIKLVVHILYNLLQKAVQQFSPNFLGHVPHSVSKPSTHY